jgi:predicted ATPase
MQAHALAGALALAPSAETDRLLVAAAVLGVLAAAVEERPVLCLIDDVQWLDKPSADALVFAARRVRAELLAILFAVREGEGERFDAAGLEELLVTGLDELSAAELISRHDVEVSPTVHARLLAEAQGNPLALIELPSALSPEERTGSSALEEGIALTPRLQQLFARRTERLPGRARDRPRRPATSPPSCGPARTSTWDPTHSIPRSGRSATR